jgi:hypothetical protein
LEQYSGGFDVMRLPRQLFIVAGAAAIIAAIAIGGLTFTPFGPTVVKAVGDFTPTPDPTSCIPGETCPTYQVPTHTQPPAYTHTPTVRPTEPPEDTPAPSTSTPVPPAPTSPGGGAEGGGVRPPNTGTGGGSDGNLYAWFLGAVGAGLALAGAGAIAYGTRRG